MDTTRLSYAQKVELAELLRRDACLPPRAVCSNVYGARKEEQFLGKTCKRPTYDVRRPLTTVTTNATPVLQNRRDPTRERISPRGGMDRPGTEQGRYRPGGTLLGREMTSCMAGSLNQNARFTPPYPASSVPSGTEKRDRQRSRNVPPTSYVDHLSTDQKRELA